MIEILYELAHARKSLILRLNDFDFFISIPSKEGKEIVLPRLG